MQRTGLARLSEALWGKNDRPVGPRTQLTDVIESFTERAADRSFWLEAAELGLKAYYDRHYRGGIDVIAQDWDTLIILDACRYDLFEEKCPDHWPAALSVRSRAGHTTGFYRENFTDGPYYDTVLVTANPKSVQARGDAFHDVVKVYESDWDGELGTVMPDAMARATIEAHGTYPDKRIISHWIQPHYPFIGGDAGGYSFNGDSIWRDLRRGDLDPEAVYRDYAATLEVAIPHIQEVLDRVDGRVVVTADHGNAFGERPRLYPFPLYGHPMGIDHASIVEVPWSVIDCGPRREIVESDGTVAAAGEDGEVNRRLASLGYV